MKRSDTTMDTQSGRFVAGATPVNTITEAMVINRAKEIAVINGRNGNDYTQGDYDQAKQELTGFTNTEPTDQENQVPDTGNWSGEGVDEGKKTPVRGAKDEQTFGEDLVKQGVEEATHHQMLAGNEQTRGREE